MASADAYRRCEASWADQLTELSGHGQAGESAAGVAHCCRNAHR